MRTVKEIDEQIQKEYGYMNQLYAQINAYEQSRVYLEAEREAAKREKRNYSLMIGSMNILESRIKWKPSRSQSLLFLMKMQIL